MKLFCIALVVLAVAALSEGSSCRSTTISSNSYNYKAQTIPGISTISFMVVSKQNSRSPCTFGASFGFFGNTAWVDQGCRAKFRICSGTVPTTVRCDSNNFEPKSCYAGGDIRSISLTEQRSQSPCIEGYSYRMAGTDVEVLRGCRGTFSVIIS